MDDAQASDGGSAWPVRRLQREARRLRDGLRGRRGRSGEPIAAKRIAAAAPARGGAGPDTSPEDPPPPSPLQAAELHTVRAELAAELARLAAGRRGPASR